MQSHPTNPQLLERASGVLLNLSFDHNNKELISHGGGVEAIVKAMEHYPHESGLQHNACCALWNLGGSVANKVRKSLICQQTHYLLNGACTTSDMYVFNLTMI